MRLSWRAIIAGALSVGLLYWALHGIDWADAATRLRGSSVPLWVIAIVLSQLTFPIRALKWRAILDPVVPNVPFGPLWRSVAIGNAGNNVVGGRVGEPIRALVLTKEWPSVSVATSLTSLVVDRVFDAVVLLLLLLVSMLDPKFGIGLDLGGKTLGVIVALLAAAVIGAFAVLYLAVFAPARIERIAVALVRPIAPRFEARVSVLVHTFAAGLGVLRNPRKFVAVSLWTLLHWLVNAAAFWVSFRALGIHVPPTAALFVQGLIAVAVALPSSPGFFGPFEAAAGYALTAYEIPREFAATWAIGYHVLSYIPITVIGMWYVARLGITWKDLKRAAASESHP